MPVGPIKIAPSESGVASAIPEKSPITTLSGWLDNPTLAGATPHAPPSYTRYRNKVSWWAIVYNSVPQAVSLAGMKYAFNPGEVRWRR